MNRVEMTRTRSIGDAIGVLLEMPAQLAATLAGALANRVPERCEIPAPCWEPQPAGTCRLALPPGCSGRIRIHVTNCDWKPHVILVTARGRIAGWMAIDPTTLSLGLQERGTVVVTLRIPDDVEVGQTLTGPILVLGCNYHFVRVEVTVTECTPRLACDVFIEDCPDHIHHWYDHFYCPRPCRRAYIGKIRDG